MHFVLLNLDEQIPLPSEVLKDLSTFVRAFFGHELKVVDVPVTPIAPEMPPGWQALKERCRQTLQSKPGRPGAVAPMQLFSEQLLMCLSILKSDPVKYGVDVEGAEVILGITLNEFYHNPSGLKPEEPMPAAVTQDFFIGSAARRVGAFSVAQLDFEEPVRHFTSSLTRSRGSQKLPRQIFKLVANSLLALLGLRTCSSQQCAAYRQPFALEVTPLHLCMQCEDALLRRMHPGSTDTLVSAASARYCNLAQALDGVSDRLNTIQLGYRRFKEFEEECDWLRMGDEILKECASERFQFSGINGPRCRRRSLFQCLREVHERQPGRTLHRIHGQPLVKRTCLADMAQSAPYRHESGDLNKWSTLVINRAHSSGGHYVEVGGSLQPKTLGTFVESGLNASLVQNVPDGQTIREKRLTRHQFYGTTVLKHRMGVTHDPNLANTEVLSRTKDRPGFTQEWKPMRARRNAHSMSYTVSLPSLASTA